MLALVCVMWSVTSVTSVTGFCLAVLEISDVTDRSVTVSSRQSIDAQAILRVLSLCVFLGLGIAPAISSPPFGYVFSGGENVNSGSVLLWVGQLPMCVCVCVCVCVK